MKNEKIKGFPGKCGRLEKYLAFPRFDGVKTHPNIISLYSYTSQHVLGALERKSAQHWGVYEIQRNQCFELTMKNRIFRILNFLGFFFLLKTRFGFVKAPRAAVRSYAFILFLQRFTWALLIMFVDRIGCTTSLNA